MIYFLGVGINEYPLGVRELSGCVNDIQNFNNYLENAYGEKNVDSILLTDHQATRKNVIHSFRNHLTKAQKDDIAIFYYAGHGSQESAHPAFNNHKNETLLLFDSRTDGYDLADKELALLISEIGKNKPHILVISDSCYAESVTRDGEDEQLSFRFQSGSEEIRPLDTYLDGYYQQQFLKNKQLEVPEHPHILLAACQNFEKAAGLDAGGLFSIALLSALRETRRDLSYNELMMRCRAQVQVLRKIQRPKLNAIHGFNPYQVFLSKEASKTQRRYIIRFNTDTNQWLIEFGIQFCPLDLKTDAKQEILLYQRYADEQPIGRVEIKMIGLQKSVLGGALLYSLDRSIPYYGLPTRLNLVTHTITIKAIPPQSLERLQELAAKNDDYAIHFSDLDSPASRFALSWSTEKEAFEIMDKIHLKRVAGVRGNEIAALVYLLQIIKNLIYWEHMAALSNTSSQLDESDFEFDLYNGATKLENREITLNYSNEMIPLQLKCKNKSGRDLFFYGVYIWPNYKVECSRYSCLISGSNNETKLLWQRKFYLPGEKQDADRYDQAENIFKLFVSATDLDTHLFEIDRPKDEIIDLNALPSLSNSRFSEGAQLLDDWLVLTIRVKVVRE